MVEANNSGRRHVVGHNKTRMAMPTFDHAPNIQPEQKGFGKLKGLLGLKKRDDQPEKIELPEPDFLKEIDTNTEVDTNVNKIGQVEPELALWLNDGREIRSVGELEKALKSISGRIFNQHKDKGDISNWVRDVIGNLQLASELLAAKNKKDAITIIQNSRKIEKKLQQKEIPKDIKRSEIENAIEKVTLNNPPASSLCP